MTEEEKKAVEKLDELLGLTVNAYNDEVYERDRKLYKEYVEVYETILNLIEKLKKEIEEKTIIIMAGAEKVKQLEKEFIIKQEVKENYIPKDKIRELIKSKLIKVYDSSYVIEIEDIIELLKEE